MTTVQESTNGHRVSPPPCSVENPAEVIPADLPASKVNINQLATDDQVVERQKGVPIDPPLATDAQVVEPKKAVPSRNEVSRSRPEGTAFFRHEEVEPDEGAFAANAYHVPPTRFVPKPNAYRQDNTLDLPPETSPLPERCQFMFSDGRQCTMARSDIHPSLCRFHAEREDQLFGDPTAGAKVVGRALDLPELYSACADLSTAAGLSRALAQVFRLLAQRRISRQEAATFAKLGHLLLQTIRAARAESDVQPEDKLPPVSAAVHKPERHAVAKAVSATKSEEAVPPSPMGDAPDVPQTWVMQSPVAIAQVLSPPNSQPSQNEQIQNLST